LKEKTVAPLLDHVFLIHTTTPIPDPQPLQRAPHDAFAARASG
jgi:hypothetical protein